eukprot:11928.XXX_290686_290976_1 [CDS] Oithona nana genome sequencing.
MKECLVTHDLTHLFLHVMLISIFGFGSATEQNDSQINSLPQKDQGEENGETANDQARQVQILEIFTIGIHLGLAGFTNLVIFFNDVVGVIDDKGCH